MKTLEDRISSALNLERKPVLEGWTTPTKAIAMANLILEHKAEFIVEIGVFGGRSLIPMAMAAQVNGFGGVFGIDPWTQDAVKDGESDAADREWWAKVDLDAIAQGCWQAIVAEGLTNCTALLRARAELISWVFQAGSIDVLSIDGNHSELASCRDVRLYLPLVKQGGHIWFDDVDWKTTGKAQAMLGAVCDRLTIVEGCALYRKT